MKSAAVLSVLALVAGVAAHEHNHERFHQERAALAAAAQEDAASCTVSVVTVTSYGEWGLVTDAPAPSTSSPAPAPPAAPATTPAPAPAPAPPTYHDNSAPGSTYQAPAAPAPAVNVPAAAPIAPFNNSPAPPSSSNSGSCSASITPSGDKWAFCYTPYRSDGGCKNDVEVSNDLGDLKNKGFGTIRTYAGDCDGLINIGKAARTHGLKLLVGINIGPSGLGGDTDAQLNALKSWAQWDMVAMVIAGNEAVFNGWASAGAVAGFISRVKSELKGAGYCGPVTTAETLNVLQANADTFCGVIDVVGANVHPYFNTDVSAFIVGPFIVGQYAALNAVCGGSKPAYILETGWPSSGNANGLAIPGFDAQRTAINNIVGAVGTKAAIFSYQNDNWKAPGPFGVEQNWGCSGLF